jgi:predicted transcriptional regulator
MSGPPALEKAARLLMEAIEAEARLRQPKVKALLKALAEPKAISQRPPEGQGRAFYGGSSP